MMPELFLYEKMRLPEAYIIYQKYVLNPISKRKFKWNKNTKEGYWKQIVEEIQKKGEEGIVWKFTSSSSQYGIDPQLEKDILNLDDDNLDHFLSLFIMSFLKKNWIRSTCHTKFTTLAGIFGDKKIASNKNPKFNLIRKTIDAVLKVKYQQDKDPHNRKRSAYSKEQLSKILQSEFCEIKTPMGLLCRAIFIFGIGFGMRISELLSAEFSDFSKEKIDGKNYLSYYPNGKAVKTANGGLNKKVPEKKYLIEMKGSPNCPLSLLSLLEKHKVSNFLFNQINKIKGDTWYIDKE